ncbi:MAG: hypothetical protein U1G08_21075 [Verrucomicrobiota bacterium]
MYPTSGATIRADLNFVVEEASAGEKFLIGLQVLPPMPVDAKSGTYPKLKISEAALADAVSTERARGGSYGTISRKWDVDNYDCIDRGLEEAVDDADQGHRTLLQPGGDCRPVDPAEHPLRPRGPRRGRILGGFAATAATVDYTAANQATIDFVADILAAIDRIEDQATDADTIVIPKAVFTRLSLSPKLQAWVRGQLKGNAEMPVNAENIAASFADYGIKRVLIGRARQNTAKKGQAKAMAQIWPNTHIWVGKTNPGARMPQDGGAGFTLYWNKEGGIYTSETYRDESKRSNMVRVRQNTAEKITDPTAGTLIVTNYA